jgi:hypothetical protein
MNFIDMTNNYLFKYIKMFLRSSFLTDNNSFDCIHPEKVTLSFPSDIATHCLIFPEYPELSATALYPFP